MKKNFREPIVAVLLSLTALFWGCGSKNHTAQEITHTTAISNEVAARIKAVENNLLPSIIVEDKEIDAANSLQERMEFFHVPGVSAAVINNGKIEWAKGWGFAEKDTNKKVDVETLFQAASISKPFSAAAALALVDKGKLSLDEEANSYLKSWKIPENEFTAQNKVTLRHILSHYAGLTAYGFHGYTVRDKVPTLVQLLKGIPPANSPPVRVEMEPGTRFRYSNGGYYVLQQIMIDVVGKEFPQLMHDLLLKPLGLKHSTFAQPLPPSLAANAAAGYRSSGEMVKGKYYTYPGSATGGLWTTASDIARFAIEIQESLAGQSDRVVSREMARALIDSRELEFGLGIGSEGEGESLSFSFAGRSDGFVCWMTAFVKTGKGAVVMTNSDNGIYVCTELLRSISRVYGWPAFRPSEPLKKRPVKIDPALFESVPGRYSFGRGINADVYAKEGKLYLKDNDNCIDCRLYPESRRKFFVSWARGRTYEFILDEKDQAKELIMTISNRTYRGQRINR